jgi:hypothetical protein
MTAVGPAAGQAQDSPPARRATSVRSCLLARLPEEAGALLAACRQEGSATDELFKLFELMLARCAALKESYGAELMGFTQARLPGF